jgi:dTDP-4-dehydrorhamnose 3,5-epimerase-like enzyme
VAQRRRSLYGNPAANERDGRLSIGSGVTDGELKITVIKDSGDDRGSSFSAPTGSFEEGFAVRDAHLSTLQPGHVRGNHFHIARHEVLLVTSVDRWSLHWDNGTGTPVEYRSFDGATAVVIQVPPYASHAIKNDGTAPLHIVGLTDGPYDPAAPDAYPRQVIRPLTRSPGRR